MSRVSFQPKDNGMIEVVTGKNADVAKSRCFGRKIKLTFDYKAAGGTVISRTETVNRSSLIKYLNKGLDKHEKLDRGWGLNLFGGSKDSDISNLFLAKHGQTKALYEKGNTLRDQGKFKEAVKAYEVCYRYGNVDAGIEAAKIYLSGGHGVKQDIVKAWQVLAVTNHPLHGEEEANAGLKIGEALLNMAVTIAKRPDLFKQLSHNGKPMGDVHPIIEHAQNQFKNATQSSDPQIQKKGEEGKQRCTEMSDTIGLSDDEIAANAAKEAATKAANKAAADAKKANEDKRDVAVAQLNKNLPSTANTFRDVAQTRYIEAFKKGFDPGIDYTPENLKKISEAIKQKISVINKVEDLDKDKFDATLNVAAIISS